MPLNADEVLHAKVAKLVDAQDSGSCSHYGCMGSSPFFRIYPGVFPRVFFYVCLRQTAAMGVAAVGVFPTGNHG